MFSMPKHGYEGFYVLKFFGGGSVELKKRVCVLFSVSYVELD
jgi:hypothetical protein